MADQRETFVPESVQFTANPKHTADNTRAPTRWSFAERPVVLGTLWSADGQTRDVEVELTSEEADALQSLLETAGRRAQ